jgi:hypothetical protein
MWAMGLGELMLRDEDVLGGIRHGGCPPGRGDPTS